jgi:hypothetical protein
VTVKFVESGLAPGVTAAPSVVELPAGTGFGLADPAAVGGVDELETVRLMLKLPDRLWSSVTLQACAYVFVGVAAGTVYCEEKVVAVWAASEKLELPPMLVRSQVPLFPWRPG